MTCHEVRVQVFPTVTESQDVHVLGFESVLQGSTQGRDQVAETPGLVNRQSGRRAHVSARHDEKVPHIGRLLSFRDREMARDEMLILRDDQITCHQRVGELDAYWTSRHRDGQVLGTASARRIVRERITISVET